MKFSLSVILLFLVSGSIAQKKQNVYFLKNDGRYVNLRDSADYMRIVQEPDSGSTLYNVFEFYLDGKRKLMGKSETIDPPKFEGQCVEFYKNGKKKRLANYKNGLIADFEYRFYTNGKTYMQREYPDSVKVDNEFNDNYLIIANYDSLGTALVENGNGYFKGYDDRFRYIEEEGKVKNGKRDSTWKGQYKNIKVTFTETYQNGLLSAGTAIDSAGVPTNYKNSRNTSPQFNGGLDAFYKYLGKNIDYPYYDREHNIQGKVVLSFVVEKSGQITNVEVKKSVSRDLDHEAIRILKKSPLWIPGTLCGKPVRCLYTIPILFSLSD